MEKENKYMSILNYYETYDNLYDNLSRNTLKEENLRLERHIKIQDIEIESLNIEIESLKQKLKNK